jgi:hypothetical protein
MTREEAHALALREVLEHVEFDKLREGAASWGKTPLEYAVGALRGALPEVHRGLMSGQLMTGEITSLAALCIELLRECHLEHYNTKRRQS